MYSTYLYHLASKVVMPTNFLKRPKYGLSYLKMIKIKNCYKLMTN